MVELKNVIVEEHYALTFDALFRLIHGETVALRINSFVNESLCNKWQGKMTNNAQFSRYANASEFGVSKVGMSLFEIEKDKSLLQSYFQHSDKIEKELEDIFDPYPNPLQMIQLGLDNLWPDGAKPMKIEGKTVCPGILRCIEKENNRGLPPHRDTIHSDIKHFNIDSKIKIQLAANLYIQVPEAGGELEIWPVTLDARELDSYYTGEFDFIDRNKLSDPIVIKPIQGEMVLFRSDCIHAVRSGSTSDRITASCFVGYSGEFDPLKYWA